MKKIVYGRSDGGISVIHPAPQYKVAKQNPAVASMTEIEYLNFIINKDVPNGSTNVRIVDESDIPNSRENRDEWVDTGTEIKPDSVKVKDKISSLKKVESGKQSVLNKLGITKEEAFHLGSILNDNKP